MSDQKTKVGMYDKFYVERLDGQSAIGGKHHGCKYFVLDLCHDKFAKAAILAYALACRNTHRKLSEDLAKIYNDFPMAQDPVADETQSEYIARLKAEVDEAEAACVAVAAEEGEATRKAIQERDDIIAAIGDVLNECNHARRFGTHEGLVQWIKSHKGKWTVAHQCQMDAERERDEVIARAETMENALIEIRDHAASRWSSVHRVYENIAKAALGPRGE